MEYHFCGLPKSLLFLLGSVERSDCTVSSTRAVRVAPELYVWCQSCTCTASLRVHLQRFQAVCHRCCCSSLGLASLLCCEIQLFSHPRQSMGKSTDFRALVLCSVPLNESEKPSLKKKTHRKRRMLGLAAAESMLELAPQGGLVSPLCYLPL